MTGDEIEIDFLPTGGIYGTLAGLAGAASATPEARDTGDVHRHPSLGMLALGSDGLPLWRREEKLVH